MGKQILNGVLYGSGEIIKFSPEIYSTSEREIGVWVDGKPLYKCTFILSTPITVDGTGTVLPNDIQTALTNVDIIADARCSRSAEYAAYISPYVYKVNGSWYILSTDTWGQVKYITVSYTKTTDTPGSGRYSTDGSLATIKKTLWTGTQGQTGTITLNGSIEHFDELILKWSAYKSALSDYDIYCKNETILVSDIIYQKQGQFFGSMFMPQGNYVSYGSFFSYNFTDANTLNIQEIYNATDSDFHLLSVTGIRHG